MIPSSSQERPEHWGPPVINPTDIVKEKKIGEGQYGEVYKGRCRGTDVAVKIPVRQDLSSDEIESVKAEVLTMSQIYHPNIVLFMGACTEPKNIAIVTELLKCDLNKFLRTEEGITLSKGERIEMMIGAAKGMAWLHETSNKVHRDLKPANMLVDAQHNVKITDFGFAETLKHGYKLRDKDGPKGTFLWMAPEVMNEEEFDKSLDVYSFGLILWETWNGVEPFGEYDDYEQFFEAVVVLNERPEPLEYAPPALNDLIERCWHKNPKLRPTFSECVEILKEVRIELDIFDEQGCAWWKKNFRTEFRIPWTTLTKALGVKQRALINCLKIFLIDPASKTEEVTLKSFQHTVDLIGPFYNPAQSVKLLTEIQNAVSKPYFFGYDSRQVVENLLVKHRDGGYLLRISTTEWQFIFSFKQSDGNFSHRKITRNVAQNGDTSFTCGKYTNTLHALVEDLVDAFELTTPPQKNEAQNLYQ